VAARVLWELKPPNITRVEFPMTYSNSKSKQIARHRGLDNFCQTFSTTISNIDVNVLGDARRLSI